MTRAITTRRPGRAAASLFACLAAACAPGHGERSADSAIRSDGPSPGEGQAWRPDAAPAADAAPLADAVAEADARADACMGCPLAAATLAAPVSHAVSTQLAGCSDTADAPNYCPTLVTVKTTLETAAPIVAEGSATLREDGSSDSIMGTVALQCFGPDGQLISAGDSRITMVSNVLGADNPAGFTMAPAIVIRPPAAGALSCRLIFDGEKTAPPPGERLTATAASLALSGPMRAGSQNVRKSARTVLRGGAAVGVSRAGISVDPAAASVTLTPLVSASVCIGSDVSAGICAAGDDSAGSAELEVSVRLLQYAGATVCADHTFAADRQKISDARHHLARRYTQRTVTLTAGCPTDNLKAVLTVKHLAGSAAYVDTTTNLAVVVR